MMKSMSRPSVSMSASRPRAPDITQSLVHAGSVNGLRIAYATAGAGSPAVCLVHGTGGSSEAWMRQLEGLADLGHIVALDLPGHGHSGGTIPKRIEDAAAVVGGVLDALGITRVAIGGHSMGGGMGQHIA